MVSKQEEEKKLKKEKNRQKHLKQRTKARKRRKEELMKLVPKTNEDGIVFTKLQIRRMLKRVKRGLPPIPTAEEEQELKRQEAILNKQEDALLAGQTDTVNDALMNNEEEEEDGDDDDDSHKEKEDAAMNDGDDDSHEVEEDEGGEATTNEQAAAAPSNDATDSTTPSRKRKARRKPVPDDYVCQACQNQHEPAHWIYDCPSKITKRGSNNISKKLRGIHAPDDRKVFVSGLAFDMKKRDVESLFKDCGTIVHCKLLTFPDTGRCKGQAYVTFDSEASARKAKKLSGTTISADDEEPSTKKKRKESPSKRKELKLKVTKVLNRTQTKHKNAL